MLQGIIFIVAGMLFLAVGAYLLVKGATALALLFRVSPAVIGLTVVAVGTSLPELFVSLTAQFGNYPQLLMGNLIGSNLLNIALVVGLTAVLLPIPVDRLAVKLEWPWMMGITAAAFFFFLDQRLVLWEGAVLLAGTVGVTILFFKKGGQDHDAALKSESEEVNQVRKNIEGPKRTQMLFLYIGGLVLGFFLLRWGSSIFVKGATGLALLWGLSERLVGLTIVAIGTSLPELAVSLIATMKGRSDVAIGNIIGSNIFNIAGVAGVCALIQPIPISNALFRVDFPWLLGLSFLFGLCLIRTEKVSRLRGSVLLAAYGIYLVLIGGISS